MDTTQTTIDPAAASEIVQRLLEKINACYVCPDIAEKICLRLQKFIEDGEYTHSSSGRALASRLTRHMQSVSHDEHLWVRWHQDPLPDFEAQLRLNQEWQDERKLEARLDNYGLRRVERLPGNIGYLDIRYFHRPQWGGETAAAAMSFIANTDALIIDLRNCTGGYPGMIALISSYLFEIEAVHLGSVYWRDDDLTQQYWTLPYVPGVRYGDKPVYVLISQVTFSGGEAFAYNLQVLQRATVIGEKTDGGAHPGASYRLDAHFEVFIPIGRAINPLTGADWEGIGVTPDISIPSEQALQVACRLALESIIKNIAEPASGPYVQLWVEAQEALDGLARTG